MLKGEIFSEQYYHSEICALFNSRILNGTNGVDTNFKNGMNVTYSGSNLTIDTGVVIIGGRALYEDSTTTIAAPTNRFILYFSSRN